jgi:hypothetical protein
MSTPAGPGTDHGTTTPVTAVLADVVVMRADPLAVNALVLERLNLPIASAPAGPAVDPVLVQATAPG